MKKILITFLTHGDETLGLQVAKSIEKKYPFLIGKGVYLLLSNPRAAQKNKRYIDEDLNRVFPGKKNGNYEQRRAYEIKKYLKSFDLVIDIHSTKSETKDTVIITKNTPLNKKIIRLVQPKYVLEMKYQSQGALITHAKSGIALEFGNNDKVNVFQKTNRAVEAVINSFFKKEERGGGLGYKTKWYVVHKAIEKPKGYFLKPNIKNFKLVKKGQIYATTKNRQDLVATSAFYPVIFGQNNYETIFGFGAKAKR